MIRAALASLLLAWPAIAADCPQDTLEGGLRLMVLGDSIAWGAGDTEGANGGWRNDVKTLMDGNGFAVNFVGRKRTGSLRDSSHEASVGAFADTFTTGFIDAAILANPPEMIVLAVGHNDAGSQAQSGADILDEIDAILDHLDASHPTIDVVVSEVLDNTAFTAALRTRIQDFNSGLAAMLSPHPRASACLTSVVDPDRPDTVHPSATGHASLAPVYYECITGEAP